MSLSDIENKIYWFVGAMIDDEDQVDRFISEGIWENGYETKYTELVKTIKTDDLIAIKSTYTRNLSISTISITSNGRDSLTYGRYL